MTTDETIQELSVRIKNLEIELLKSKQGHSACCADRDHWKADVLHLRRVIHDTIMENLHLADGDDCTLNALKKAINFELPPEP